MIPAFRKTGRPTDYIAGILPIDPAEQAALDELRRRRAASHDARPSHASAVEVGAGNGDTK